MAPSFSKNAILMGAVDHFCLVCEAYFKCENDILAHIGKPVHKKSLDATEYVDTLKKDHIRKIKSKYFCEICNLLINILAKVRVHIKGEKHVQNIRNLSLKRKGKEIIAFDDIVITEQAWNGLHDDSCVLCNTEYEDENIHKTQTTHVLNLVQIKVEMDEHKNIYRKIDQSIFHCLTCNTALALDSIASHWNTPAHINLYEACRDALRSASVPIKLTSKIENNKSNQNSVIGAFVDLSNSNNLTEKKNLLDVKTTKPESSRSSVLNKEITDSNKTKENVINKKKMEIYDSLPWLQENSVNVTFETGIAYCEKCHATLILDLQNLKEHIKQHHQANPINNTTLKSTSPIVLKNDKIDEVSASFIKCEKGETEASAQPNHIESNQRTEPKSNNKTASKCKRPVELKSEDKDKPKTSTMKTQNEEMEVLFRTNNMELHLDEEFIYCKSCNMTISNTVKSVNNHIKTWVHKKKVKKQNPSIQKKCFNEYLNSLFDTDTSYINSDIIINEKICIRYFSFMFYTSIMGNNSRTRCQACETNVSISDLMHHKNSKVHSEAMNKIPVVMSADLTSEFVREVRSNIYHCGFCNLIIMSWQNMELHLKSVEHHNEKSESQARLRLHIPKIRNERFRRQVENQIFGDLLSSLFQ